MDKLALSQHVEKIWGKRGEISPKTLGEERSIIDQVMNGLDKGELRVASRTDNGWVAHEWVKKAVLLSFRMNDNKILSGYGMNVPFFDKVPYKFQNWSHEDFQKAGFRAVPGAIVRRSAYIAPNVVLMPSFVNVGARIGEGSMIDTWATVGSCAQVGKNCHISGGVGLGGVLEPLQATPVIIEDNCFIGARSEIAEGVIVEQGAVISMGVFIGASTKIIDRKTGEVFTGRVPAYSVVVPGVRPASDIKGGDHTPNLSCAVIVKRVDERTRSKVSINELLRD